MTVSQVYEEVPLDLTDKRILVTGGRGFLGKHLVSELRNRGCKYIWDPSSSDMNLLRRSDISWVLKEYKPELVFHLAANVGGIGANREHPAEFFYNNLMMGAQLIHECWLSKVGKFISVGTVCSYPKFTRVPFKEDDLWNGYPEETNAPYGIAKKALLVQAQAYRTQYGFNAIYLLPVNLYGPGDNFDLETSHVIPALIRKFIEAKESCLSEVVCWGDGTPSREFLYVKDAVEGLLLAAKLYNGSEPVNIGSGREIRISDLVKLIADKVGYEGKIIWDISKPNGQPRRCLDVSRAKQLFRFCSNTEFEFGLRETINWYIINKKEIV